MRPIPEFGLRCYQKPSSGDFSYFLVPYSANSHLNRQSTFYFELKEIATVAPLKNFRLPISARSLSVPFTWKKSSIKSYMKHIFVKILDNWFQRPTMSISKEKDTKKALLATSAAFSITSRNGCHHWCRDFLSNRCRCC